MNMFCYQCQEAAKGTGCEVVGVIGKTIILYKENKENPKVSLELKESLR